MKRKKLINKKFKKKADKKCYFCSCDNYDLLNIHRIVEGENGGTYEELNTVTLCVMCHRKVHVGLIKIFRKYLSTKQGWILHYIDENGIEHFN